MSDLLADFINRWKRFADELDGPPARLIECFGWLLPEDAAPCLCFREATHPSAVWDVYGQLSGYSDATRDRLSAYRVIGSDGAGNPICLDVRSDAIVLLDYEDRFRSNQFMNSGVPQLGESLLEYGKSYRSLFDTEFAAEGSDGQLEHYFRAVVKRIDPAAMQERSFWWHAAFDLRPE